MTYVQTQTETTAEALPTCDCLSNVSVPERRSLCATQSRAWILCKYYLSVGLLIPPLSVAIYHCRYEMMLSRDLISEDAEANKDILKAWDAYVMRELKNYKGKNSYTRMLYYFA